MNQQVEIKAEIPEQNQAPVVTAGQTQPEDAIEPNLSDINKPNWKQFREQKDQERKQRLEAERVAREERERAQALQAALEAAVSKGYQQPVHEDENEEQILEKKVQTILAQREHEYERKRAEKEQAELPQKLQTTFNDFGQVCSTENLDYLEFHYPEIATPFKHMPDGFDKWASIYKTLKRLVPNPDSKKDVQKIANNLAKPQSMSAPGTTQGGNAMPGARLDESRKADNWARMQRTLKGLS